MTGIPTFFVNGEDYDGETTIEAFRAKIDPLLQLSGAIGARG